MKGRGRPIGLPGGTEGEKKKRPAIYWRAFKPVLLWRNNLIAKVLLFYLIRPLSSPLFILRQAQDERATFGPSGPFSPLRPSPQALCRPLPPYPFTTVSGAFLSFFVPDSANMAKFVPESVL